jgi:hypothetical protein
LTTLSKVESLEEGYETCEEDVLLGQIVMIETLADIPFLYKLPHPFPGLPIHGGEVSHRRMQYCKVLCHNICVVIQSMYELGIEPSFWTGQGTQKVEPTFCAETHFAHNIPQK